MNCEVCNLTLNGIQQYDQHMAGKAHAKKLKAAASGNPAAAPVKINFVPASGNDAHLHSVQPVGSTQKMATIAYQIPAPQVQKQYVPPQAQNPPTGKKKKKKKGLGSQQPAPAVSTVSSSDDPQIYCDGVTVIGLSPVPTDLWCEICQLQLNAPDQAAQHYSGSKHIKKARLYRLHQVGGFAESTSGHGDHFCSFCGIYVNSYDQMEIHRAGAQHKKQVERRKRKQEETSAEPTATKAKSAEGTSGGGADVSKGELTPVPSPSSSQGNGFQYPTLFDVQPPL
ncbi:hypothetical protein BaRGS_00019574, partial [Batillaria attramentaria]